MHRIATKIPNKTAPWRVEPNPYSRSKVAGERLLERMIREEGAPVTIVRPGWIYGPRDVASFARFAAMIERGQMVMLGSGRNHIPLIYVRLVADGILLASEKARAAGVERAVFDRGGRLYHGRVKALAEGAREGGLRI